MFGGLLQPAHLLVILIILVLVLGPSRLHGIGRALGQSWRSLVAGFRSGGEDQSSQEALPARPCPRCGVWSGEVANYCTRCGTALG
jgi:sec-independent protein translocase protein TatA